MLNTPSGHTSVECDLGWSQAAFSTTDSTPVPGEKPRSAPQTAPQVPETLGCVPPGLRAGLHVPQWATVCLFLGVTGPYLASIPPSSDFCTQLNHRILLRMSLIRMKWVCECGMYRHTCVCARRDQPHVQCTPRRSSPLVPTFPPSVIP